MPTEPYTLVIVDMQPDFEAARCEETIEAVIELIAQAYVDGMPIVVLEYDDYCRTDDRVMEALEGTDYHVVGKDNDDGSDEIFQVVAAYLVPTRFKVCGVNYSACVAATVDGLIRGHGIDPQNIEVIEKACNQPDSWEQWDSWRCKTEWFKKNSVAVV